MGEAGINLVCEVHTRLVGGVWESSLKVRLLPYGVYDRTVCVSALSAYTEATQGASKPCSSPACRRSHPEYANAGKPDCRDRRCLGSSDTQGMHHLKAAELLLWLPNFFSSIAQAPQNAKQPAFRPLG
jgi:hypothetical protein